MNGRRRSAHGLARGLTALVLALFALGWLADRAHVAFEAHAWCADHQRIEHAGASDAIDAHGDPDRGPAFDATEPGAEQHEACCILLGRGGDPILLAAAFVASVLAPAEAACPPSDLDTSARGPIAPIALAPKHSPPAA